MNGPTLVLRVIVALALVVGLVHIAFGVISLGDPVAALIYFALGAGFSGLAIVGHHIERTTR